MVMLPEQVRVAHILWRHNFTFCAEETKPIKVLHKALPAIYDFIKKMTERTASKKS